MPELAGEGGARDLEHEGLAARREGVGEGACGVEPAMGSVAGCGIRQDLVVAELHMGGVLPDRLAGVTVGEASGA